MRELQRRRARYAPVVEEDGEAEVARFQATHRRFSDRIERAVMQLIILGLVLIGLTQIMALSPAIRRVAVRLDGLEGVAWKQAPALVAPAQESEEPARGASAVVSPIGTSKVTVMMTGTSSAPAVVLTVNGEAAGHFTGPSLTVAVKPGDRLAIDATGTPDELTFRVVDAKGVAQPALGHEVKTMGGKRTLGVVKTSE